MISVTIIVKNGEKYLAKCLSALQTFDEIILLDNGSRDRTLEIAARFQNTKIIKHDFTGFGPLKNLAADHAGNSWILSIDCDEILSPELLGEIKSLSLDEQCVYRFSRRSYYNQKWIRGCGWYPDKILRLYNKESSAFNANQVQESVVVKPDMRIEDLRGFIRHYPYHNIEELLDKAQFYASLYARQYRGNKKSSPLKAVVRGTAAFLKGYVLRKGWRDGYEGFVISFSQGFAAFLKYLKLYELNRDDDGQSAASSRFESGTDRGSG